MRVTHGTLAVETLCWMIGDSEFEMLDRHENF